MVNLNHSNLALSKIYYSLGLELSKDFPYLESSYHELHNLWQNYFNKIENVKLVILGEAPLWGSKKNYIYNPQTPNTQFFHRSDLQPILGFVPSNKENLLCALQELGILILDVSPFALNPKDTQLTYPELSIRMYKQLVQGCWEEHIKPVVDQISNLSPIYVFRYKRVKDIFEDLFKEKLSIDEIPSIHQQGGGIDKEKLFEIYQNISTHHISTHPDFLVSPDDKGIPGPFHC